ncbi:MAG: hypothetical protein RBU30_05335 [Polyangia bacterium]|jgi:hypothetical protein|nr:hypothetical protein [Polyangia bacterium]
MREYPQVRQLEDEGPRRWFGDQDLELIVWYGRDAPSTIVGFQLCYDKRQDEHALTWRLGGSVSHHRVDTGDGLPKANRTPILVADGPLPLMRLTDRFREASAAIDPAIRAFVLGRLGELDPKDIR